MKNRAWQESLERWYEQFRGDTFSSPTGTSSIVGVDYATGSSRGVDAYWNGVPVLTSEHEATVERIIPHFLRCEYCKVANPVNEEVMFCLCCGSPLPLWEFSKPLKHITVMGDAHIGKSSTSRLRQLIERNTIGK